MDQKPTYDELEKQIALLKIENDAIRREKKSIENSEALYRLTLENISDTVIITDNEGNIIYACPNSRYIFDLSQSQIYEKKTVQNLINGNICDLSKLKIAQEISNIEWNIKDKLGRDHFLLVTIKAISIKGATVLYVMRDITDRKRIEAALQQSEKKYRKLYEDAAIGIFHSSFEGRFLDVNPALAKMLGYEKPHEVVDSIYSIAEQIYVEPQARDEVIAQALAKGETVKVENLYRRRDGSEWNAYLHLRYVLDSNGRPFYLEGFVEDITERKKAEKALQESEEKYRLLIEKANEAIFIAQDEVVKFPNPKTIEITGYSEDELATMQFANLIHPEDRQMVSERYRQRLNGQNPPSNYAFRIINKLGSELWLQINSAPIKWEGRPATINFINDITEQRKLEEQVRQAHKMESISTLAGGIAHEFNNMLAIIIGNAELAIDDIPESNPSADCIQEIRNAGLRAKDVVLKLLSVSQKTSTSRKPLQISTAIKESLHLIRKTIPATIEIKSNLTSKTEMIMGDPTEISQILINLCTNSVQAMRDQTGVIEVNMETIQLDRQSSMRHQELKPGNYAKLTIRDSGEGIEPELIDRVFDPYFTTKDIDKGLGMGLAVVLGVVNNHDGAINIESVVGKGTTVEVLFPLIKEQALVSTETTDTPSTGAERILFVDDEASLVKMATLMLERSGYEVEGKTSSIEALKVFRDNPERFALVITDMSMPDMAGDRLAQEINRVRPNMPIILCTGYSDNIDEDRALELGINSFVMKPISKADLTKTVRNVLGEAKR